MSKRELLHACRTCHATHAKWTGRCKACGAFNTLSLVTPRISKEQKGIDEMPFAAELVPEEGRGRYVVSRGEREEAGGGAPRRVEMPATRPVLSRARDMPIVEMKRRTTGLAGLDRVLGGGAPDGAIVLLGGNAGLGKTTLLLQSLAAFSKEGPSVYISSEQPSAAILRVARRIEPETPRAMDVFVHHERSMEKTLAILKEVRPFACALDSIQAFAEEGYTAGTYAESAKVATTFAYAAQDLGIFLYLVSQVNKELDVAGFKTLDHLVDIHIMLTGDKATPFRTLHAEKNREGSLGRATFRIAKTGLSDSTEAEEEGAIADAAEEEEELRDE